MKALYVNDVSKQESEIYQLKEAGFDLDEREIRLFTNTSRFAGFPYQRDCIGCLFYPNLNDSFEQVLVGSSLRLMVSQWAKAFLQQLNDFLHLNGTIVLHFFPEREALKKGYWSLALLQEFFRQNGCVVEGHPYVIFKRSEQLGKIDSVLTWFFTDYTKILIEELTIRDFISELKDEDIQKLCSDFLHLGKKVTTKYIEKTSVTLSDVLSNQCYFMGGISYKSTLMSHIISQYFDKNEELYLLDHGGGYGLLVTELMLNQSFNIIKGVNCDINGLNMMLCRYVFSYFREKLVGRFRAYLAASEYFEYDDHYHIISFIGSLLYVPKNKTFDTLERAWNSLNPGGILVVHENIKAPSYKRDYEIMFTVDEIEGLLRQFGSIDYYLSTATVSITKEQAGAKSVFRVLRKPS